MKRLIFAIIFLSPILAIGQKQPVEAKLSDENSFSIVVLPDIQSYVKFDVNQPIVDLMTAWCSNNMESLNILTVLCTGDIVEQNEIRVPDGVNGNQTSEEQWSSASKSFERLDGKIPYVLATGNHDYGYKSSENRMSNFHKYFPSERNSKWKGVLVNAAPNFYGVPTLENAAYEFNTESWGKLLILSLEFAPRDAALEWAKSVIDSYKDHKVIILTHSYLDVKGELIEKESYKVEDANYGVAICEKVVKPSKNVCLVVCGHSATGSGDYHENVSFSYSVNNFGDKVPQMMFNAQTAGGGWFGNGGDGWLRYLEFMPDGKSVKVKTFSPLFAISPVTCDKAWRREIYDEFEFICN